MCTKIFGDEWLRRDSNDDFSFVKYPALCDRPAVTNIHSQICMHTLKNPKEAIDLTLRKFIAYFSFYFSLVRCVLECFV